MSSTPTVRIHFGNVYVRNRTRIRALRRLTRGKPDGVVIAEGGWAVRMVAKLLPGYRVAKARSGAAKGRDDVLVLVRRAHTYLGELAVRVTPAMPAFGPAAHDRYLVAHLFRVKGFGMVALLGWHPTPGPTALRSDADHPITEAYIDDIKAIRRTTRFLRALGYFVVLASDTQIQASSEVDWAPIINLRGMGYAIPVAEGIDLVAVDDRLDVAEAGVLDPAGETTGADHPFLFAVLRKRRG